MNHVHFVFTIQIATDVHLGYMEKDQVRGNDSIVSFQEVLEIAKSKAVSLVYKIFLNVFTPSKYQQLYSPHSIKLIGLDNMKFGYPLQMF